MNNTSSKIQFKNTVRQGSFEKKQVKKSLPKPGDEIREPLDRVQIKGTQEETPPEQPPKKVKVSFFPQDDYMDDPETAEIEQSKIGKELKGPRAVAVDRNNPVAIADPDGNFFYKPVDKQFDQVNSYYVAYRTLDLHQANVGHRIDWAFNDDRIKVNSHAGEGANAYYARWTQGVNFMYFESEGLEKTVQTAQSSDVVSHEMGHAVLDGLRPRYLYSWDKESRAFHEAFGDVSAMLYTLSEPENIEALSRETSGDLTRQNRLSMLAEEFGAAIRLMNDDPSDDHKTYLRNAINDFTYKPPEDLPSSGPREELTSEPHSFSRVFSGAFYDCFNKIYQKNLKQLPPLPPDPGEENPDQPPKPDVVGALEKTRDTLGPIFGKAIDLMPESSASFKTAALAMLKADQLLNEGANAKELTETFLDRKIITPEDIEEDRGRMKSLSGIKIDQLPTKKEAMKLLAVNQKKLGVDPDRFESVRIVTDKMGNTFIQYLAKKEVPLKSHGIYKAAGVKDLYTDVYGGMTLGFDSEGKLISMFDDPVNDKKVNQTITGIKQAKKEGLIRRQPLYKSDNLFKSKDIPYQAEIFQEPSGKFKVRRIPIVMS